MKKITFFSICCILFLMSCSNNNNSLDIETNTVESTSVPTLSQEQLNVLNQYQSSYDDIKVRLQENHQSIEKAFKMLPQQQVRMVKESRRRIMKYNLEEFLINEKLNEEELSSMISGVNFFIDQVELRDAMDLWQE